MKPIYNDHSDSGKPPQWEIIDAKLGYYHCPICGNDYYNDEDAVDSLGDCPHCGAGLLPPEE